MIKQYDFDGQCVTKSRQVLLTFAIWYLIILIAMWVVFYGIYHQKFLGFLRELLILIGSILIYGFIYFTVEFFTDTKFLSNIIFYLEFLLGVMGICLYILGIRLINRGKMLARQQN